MLYILVKNAPLNATIIVSHERNKLHVLMFDLKMINNGKMINKDQSPISNNLMIISDDDK